MAIDSRTQLPGDVKKPLSPALQKAQAKRAITNAKVAELTDRQRNHLRICRNARATLSVLIDDLIDGRDVPDDAVRGAAMLQANCV